jgi:metal-responsive CopG/Arc/MetJ family transcriptional regulator
MGERKILNISLPAEMYEAVNNMADAENKTKAELAREIIQEYMTKRDRWKLIRQWGDNSAKKLNLDSDTDLEELIHESRRKDS